MKPKSANLFHFTKSLDVLKLILASGIQPKYCLEDIKWLGSKEEYLAFPISCFCDIPLSRISEHTSFYGSYGIGLTKEWGEKNNLNPVIYTTLGGQIQKLMISLLSQLHDNKGDPNCTEDAYALWSLLKPISGSMVISKEVVEKEFYQENEWRYVVPEKKIIQYAKFEDEKEKDNKDILKYELKFSPADIKYIFVKDDSDIPELVDHINEKLGRYPHNDLKILLSRIVSLSTLRRDL